MAARKVDWSILRGTVIGFAVCVLAAAGMLSASFYFKAGMEREYQSHHRSFRQASQQYLAVDEEERIIERFYPEFVRLYRGGVLGRERRLSWLETLRHAGDAIRIPELSYKLDAQRDGASAFEVPLAGYELRASALSLSLGLLHEGDLLRLLALLESEAQGLYTVQSCSFRADGGERTLDPARANVRVECKLDWLTLDLPGTRAIAL